VPSVCASECEPQRLHPFFFFSPSVLQIRMRRPLLPLLSSTPKVLPSFRLSIDWTIRVVQRARPRLSPFILPREKGLFFFLPALFPLSPLCSCSQPINLSRLASCSKAGSIIAVRFFFFLPRPLLTRRKQLPRFPFFRGFFTLTCISALLPVVSRTPVREKVVMNSSRGRLLLTIFFDGSSLDTLRPSRS